MQKNKPNVKTALIQMFRNLHKIVVSRYEKEWIKPKKQFF